MSCEAASTNSRFVWPLVTSSLLVLLLLPAAGQKKLFCYYGSESQYRTYPGRFMPDNIDVTLCTHVIFAFADIRDNKLTSQNWNDLGTTGLYTQVTRLKTTRPSLKILLAVGGWVAGYRPFAPAVRTNKSMTEFVDNVISYLRGYGFDGLDMDWEFPGVRGSPPADKHAFTRLMKLMYNKFLEESIKSGRERLLLTMAAAVGIAFIEAAYEATEIHKYVDYMLLMTYNFHGGWDNFTSHHSTMFPGQFDQGEDRWLCQNWALNYWLFMGVPRSKILLGESMFLLRSKILLGESMFLPRSKILLGLATYGMTFTLVDEKNNGLRAPALGGGNGGRYTRQNGILAFYEICENLQHHNWTNHWIEDQQVPYTTKGDQWVGYDDVKSIRIKAERLINGYGLAGAFVWSVELDDFNGYCGGGKYPLLRAINDVIRPRNQSGAELPEPVFTQPQLPTPVSPSAKCQQLGTGLYKHEPSCRWYIICTQVAGVWGLRTGHLQLS
ncbi:chitinase-3-like protein 1 [Physella acuta]|uniref:chitinase-3-like protein 1 n=1 Tax=Physella acuta TaxID=109671 RepID=UPI0027DC0FFC|nr:chitinase-3-like protein 1 [Physella acuta]